MKLMVLDGNSILNRAYYGIRPLTTKDGLFTHAVFGFLTMLGRLEDEERPDAVCVTFDRREPTFRHLEYEGYKATRHGMPEELAMQLPIMKEVLDEMNIPRYELAGYEADDLIGTISRKCEVAGWDCVIATGDKDALQLVTEHTTVKLISTRMGQTTTKNMTPETFFEAYGFEPIHIIDLKALMGDTSDNLPGVAGIGEKTATALIQKYRSIDEIYRLLPEIEAKPAVIKRLTEGEAAARQSHHLATILTDAPISFKPEENLLKAPKKGLHQLFMRLEFNKLIEKMGLSAEPVDDAVPPAARSIERTEVTSAALAKAALAEMRKAETVCILTLPGLIGVFAVWEEKSGDTDHLIAANFASAHYSGDWNALLREIFSAKIKKVGHGVKELMHALLEKGLPAEGFVFDTALAGYLLDATSNRYELSQLVAVYFREELPAPQYLEPTAFLLPEDRAEAEGNLEEYATALCRLYRALAPLLEERGLHELYYEVELPLCRVLAEMELAGISVAARALAAFGVTMLEETDALGERIYEQAGKRFNINSPKQLGDVLFGKLGLPHGKKTKTGWSTNADVLEKLRWEYPIVEDVLRYRQYTKLKTTYCDGLLKALDPDGRVRTSFQMTATATGRLSSTEPNLQNIPTRTPLGSELRRMFVPAKGNVLVDADYSQIELRLLAHIAQDERMLEAFRSGEDIHAVTASQVFGVPLENVTKEMRSHAKAVNFGIVYGISAFSLAQDIGVKMTEAKAYIESYLERFSGVRRYMTEVVERAREQCYVETLMHRRRTLPELTASNFVTRSFGERVALNMPIQGTAADLMKLAMVRVFDRLKREEPEAKLLLQVHDELIVECPEAAAERVARILTEEMEGAMHISVPLAAEAHWGANWLEAKE